MAGGARVLCRRGLRRGARSRPFSPAELAAAERAPHETVYVDADGSGRLTARGGVARAVRAARLAGAAPHATALLAVCACSCWPRAAGEPRLQLLLAADAAPHHEPLLWFDDHALAHLDMPFLTLRNITADGDKNYTCHECGAEFDQPNPLKIHLFLSCGPPDPAAFWRRCAARLGAAAGSAAPPVGPGLAAGADPFGPDPARLEALAAAWGRSRDGHVCVYCGKLYSRKYGLKIHIRTHTGYKPLHCRHCLRAFGDPSNLNKHVRLHATARGRPGAAHARPGAAHARPGAAHACTLCRKPLARRRDLLRHLRTQHPAAAAPPDGCES